VAYQWVSAVPSSDLIEMPFIVNLKGQRRGLILQIKL
jgi:hypothetical protein